MKIEINKSTVAGAFKSYFKDNILFAAFVFMSVIDSFLLRVFTVGFSYNVIKPILADFAVTILIGLFGYIFKPRHRFPYYMVWISVFSILAAGSSIYYSNFKSFLSVSLLSTASVLGGVTNAVTNLVEIKHISLLWPIPAYIALYVFIRKKHPDYFDNLQKKNVRKKYVILNIVLCFLFTGIFASTLTGTDYSRLRKQWNREYVVATFGLYTYQISDLVSCTNAKLNMIFGFSESEAAFKDFYAEDSKVQKEDTKSEKANEYTDIFKGKNVIAIHAESIQQFTMDTYINGEPLTPNLNKLAKEGLYFSNFYAQESVGTSSDSEFTYSTSLMPASSGTVAINYCDRNYQTTQKMLKNQGYYIFSMHGNNGTYWNRMNLHESLGYDKFYNYTTDYDIDETIGLGLSDKSFFRQSVPKIKEIAQNHENFYGTMIMLTNHTPFTDIERVSDFDVDFKYKQYNEKTGLYEEVSRPFLEGKKLGSYFKSVHYADEALGQFINDLDKEGLLDNTVIVIYGDHDAKVKESDYEYYLNYDPFTDTVLTENDSGYVPLDTFYYNINRKVPFIIWSKDGGYEPQEITKVMGMYDVQPTLGNMFGFKNNFALGHDIFSFKEGEENTVIFPNGNFISDSVYFDSQKNKYFDLKDYKNVMKYVPCNQVYKNSPELVYDDNDYGDYRTAEDTEYSSAAAEKRINNGAVDSTYLTEKEEYAEERINISNAIIYYDMINKTENGFGSEKNLFNINADGSTPFSPPSSKFKSRIIAP
ncbi:MAG: LTA synthase family protein [Oscillospiraceae bacterium]